MVNESIIANDYKVNGRIWIDSGKGPFLGKGRVELLHMVKKHGSITKAAKSMSMAYRQAWHLIESMNNKASKPVVITYAGGKGGGGAELTEEGERMIREFENLEKAFIEFVKTRSEELLI